MTAVFQWIVLPAAIGVLLVTTLAAQPVKDPAPGVLLVASKQMMDPRFKQTVVLLIEHDQTGTWGLIINRATDIEVGDVWTSTEEPGVDSSVYFGGPVHLERLMFLYQEEPGPDAQHGGLPGLPELRWSDSSETLEQRLQQDPEHLRVYAGYAGWSPGQLAFEIARGDWKLIQGKADNIFSKEPEGLWDSLTDALSGIAI